LNSGNEAQHQRKTKTQCVRSMSNHCTVKVGWAPGRVKDIIRFVFKLF